MAESNFRRPAKGFATKAIHVGQEPEQWSSRCVVPPLVTSVTFKQDGPSEATGAFQYGRSGNPTRNMVEKCVASLEDGKYGLIFASGMGTTTAIMSLLEKGDHILVCDDLYGGSNRLFRRIAPKFGMEADFVDATDLELFEKAIKPNTKLVWLESPSNPLLKVIDIEALSKIAHKRPETIVAVDNTFLTSYYQRPLDLGADISMYSLTKYMNGHTDVLTGAAVLNDDKLHERLRFLQYGLGIIPSPFDCYQVNRGLKTLALRMDQHNANSLAVAKFLESHPLVEKVLHPGLPSHPQHKIAIKQSYGHSGIFSFYIKGGFEGAKKFMKALRYFTIGGSLGGYQSLIEIPSIMSHSSIVESERIRLGITNNLIRVSVGLEDADDLVADVKQALNACK